MAKQLTLFECRSGSSGSDMARLRGSTETQPSLAPTLGNGRVNGIRQIVQDNTVFVENSASTTIVINDSCNLAFSHGDNSDCDSTKDCIQEFVQNEDDGNTNCETSQTTASCTSATDDVPTDIASGPDEAPVQPRIKFPTTLKGNKHRSFCSEWYKQYRWLEYSRERNAAYCYPCRLFTTEPGKYWETFTKKDSVTGNMQWVKMGLSHVTITARPIWKPWCPGKTL